MWVADPKSNLGGEILFRLAFRGSLAPFSGHGRTGIADGCCQTVVIAAILLSERDGWKQGRVILETPLG